MSAVSKAWRQSLGTLSVTSPALVCSGRRCQPCSGMIRHARRPRFGGYVAAAGAAYWINELNTGHIQRTDFVTALIAGARGPGGSAADAQYIANREAVGAHFALTQGLTDVAWARTVEAGVNDTAASVTAANAQTDAFAATAATAAGTELVVQIVGLVP